MAARVFGCRHPVFDDNAPSVYNMCRKDYPDVMAEAMKEPVSDLQGPAHRGVHVCSQADIEKLCEASGLELELYEARKGFQLHCVVRKPQQADL